jgi:hypothetical protein
MDPPILVFVHSLKRVKVYSFGPKEEPGDSPKPKSVHVKDPLPLTLTINDILNRIALRCLQGKGCDASCFYLSIMILR